MRDTVRRGNERRNRRSVADDRRVACPIEHGDAVTDRVADVNTMRIGKEKNSQTAAGASQRTFVIRCLRRSAGGRRAEQKEKQSREQRRKSETTGQFAPS